MKKITFIYTNYIGNNFIKNNNNLSKNNHRFEKKKNYSNIKLENSSKTNGFNNNLIHPNIIAETLQNKSYSFKLLNSSLLFINKELYWLMLNNILLNNKFSNKYYLSFLIAVETIIYFICYYLGLIRFSFTTGFLIFKEICKYKTFILQFIYFIDKYIIKNIIIAFVIFNQKLIENEKKIEEKIYNSNPIKIMRNDHDKNFFYDFIDKVIKKSNIIYNKKSRNNNNKLKLNQLRKRKDNMSKKNISNKIHIFKNII